MNREFNCTDCGSVFFGHSTFGNGFGLCNICLSSRQANDRFEKEMAQRRKSERQFSHTRPDFSYSSSSQAIESFGLAILAIFMMIVFAIVVFVFLGNSPRKEYSFYTPNNGSLNQSLKPGVVYDQSNCDYTEQCVVISKNHFERFCNEFDGINTADNKEILDWKIGEITSLSREASISSFDNSQMCLIKFSMIVDGKVKTGVARVVTWTLNAEGKLVPYSSYRSTSWK